MHAYKNRAPAEICRVSDVRVHRLSNTYVYSNIHANSRHPYRLAVFAKVVTFWQEQQWDNLTHQQAGDGYVCQNGIPIFWGIGEWRPDVAMVSRL